MTTIPDVHELARFLLKACFSVSKDENSKIHFQPTIQFSQPFVHMIYPQILSHIDK